MGAGGIAHALVNALTLQSQNETVVKLGCQAIHGVSNEIRLDNIWDEKRREQKMG